MSPLVDLQEVLESEIKYAWDFLSRPSTAKPVFLSPGSGIFVYSIISTT